MEIQLIIVQGILWGENSLHFEIVRDNKTVMQCEDVICIPSVDELNAMNKAGYKFKIDGQTVTIKKIKELIKE